ncbi:MAG: tetratricopeptide repeat protein [bacterium]|nr:tetratricopeptide repeat protein [bacterium]
MQSFVSSFRACFPPVGLVLALCFAVHAPLAAADGRTAEADALYAAALKQDDVRAIKILLRAQKLAPRDKRISYRIGFLFHKMNRRPEARAAYERTIELDACHTRALNNVGNILKDQGLRDEAVARYSQAIQCDPEFSVGHYNLANLFRSAKRYTKAVKHYEAALAVTPNHYRSHHNLGLIYLRMARAAGAESVERSQFSDRARRHFGRACDLNPRDPLNFYNRGRLFEMHADRTKAVSDYKRALSLLKTNSAFKNRLRKRIQRLQVPRS